MEDDIVTQNQEIISIKNIQDVLETYCKENNISSEIKHKLDKILNEKNEENSNLANKEIRVSNFTSKENYKWCEMQYEINIQIQRKYFKEYIVGLINFYCPFYIFDSNNYDLENDNLSEDWELALSEMNRYTSFLKKSWIDIKDELLKEVIDYCYRNNVDSSIRMTLFDKCELAFKIAIMTLWGNFQVKVHRIVNVYCEANSVSKEVEDKLHKLIKIDWQLVFEIIKNAHENAITSSEATKILKNLKKFYKNISDIKPIKSDFLSYLKGNVNVVKDLSTEQLKVYVAEYIVHEESKNKLHYQKAKDKQQALIQSTPEQILSIEATAATVEDGKEVEIIIKDEVNGTPCIEFNNLFGADIAKKNEVWQYMKLLGMIDNEGKCLHPEKTATIRAFVVVMRKNFKLPFAKSPDELIKIFGLKLSISDILRVRPATEIELKEQEIVSLINAFETKNLPFT